MQRQRPRSRCAAPRRRVTRAAVAAPTSRVWGATGDQANKRGGPPHRAVATGGPCCVCVSARRGQRGVGGHQAVGCGPARRQIRGFGVVVAASRRSHVLWLRPAWPVATSSGQLSTGCVKAWRHQLAGGCPPGHLFGAPPCIRKRPRADAGAGTAKGEHEKWGVLCGSNGARHPPPDQHDAVTWHVWRATFQPFEHVLAFHGSPRTERTDVRLNANLLPHGSSTCLSR